MKQILSLLILLTSLTFAQKQSELVLLMKKDNSIAYSAETLAYIARVETDSGTVIDTNQVETSYASGINMDSTLLWVSPAFGIKKDANNKVTKLYDLSNNDHDLIQADTSKSPTWYADSIKFDGSNDYMQVNFGTDEAQPNTIVLAMLRPTTAGRYLFDGIVSNKRHAMIGGSTVYNFYSGTGVVNVADSVQAGNIIMSAMFNSTDSLYYMPNTANEFRSGANSGAQALSGITIGDAWDFGSAQAIRMYEFFIYNNTGIRPAIEAIMNTRWSIY